MNEWGDSGISAILLAIGVALLLSFVVAQHARTRAARYKEIRRLQGVAAEEARREEEEALAEYTSMVENFCAVCPNPSTTRCSRCKEARYCSSTCQVQHWKSGHKRECRAPEPVPSRASSSNGSSNSSDVCNTNGSTGSRSRTQVSEYSGEAPAESIRVTAASYGNGTLLKPKKVLFPYDYFVKYFNREGPKLPPCGLLNCGNSCFANVVLQCLTHTRPLTAYLLEGTHGEECRRSVSGDWCFMCELQDHVWRVRNRQNPISPIRILSRIRNIGNHLGYGRQEDAHEFMRFAIDSMQSICLDEAGGEKSVDPRSQETTFIHHIFGGHLQSQVQCMQCLHESNRYENMMDLAVEIQGCVETLEDALTQFTAPEWLDGENKYKCDRCNAYVKARKRLTLHEAPNILTIALKRFQSGKFGKLNKRVTFPETLDLTPYMSGKGDRPSAYKLYAVVVHVDMLNASFFGHYICYVKDSQGVWYKIDDSKVKEVDLEKVMAQRAYMLFYTRSYARPAPLTDGAVPLYPIARAADLGRVVSDRHGDFKVFPSPQYLGNEEMLEGGGSHGLHAMVDFNKMVDYVDGSRAETVPEHMQSNGTVPLSMKSNGEISTVQMKNWPACEVDCSPIQSNGEISTAQLSSWEVESTRLDNDEIELEDAGRIASSSSLTQTSPYMCSFTSKQGLWIPTQGFVCQVPESGSVEGGTEHASYDPKSSLPDDFSGVTLQPEPCTVEKPCNTKIGKRRLEDGLSPLPTPKPLDTDQLPAWPVCSQGRSNSCPPSVPQSSGSPNSCSMLDALKPSQQKYESEPLPLGYPVQQKVSNDLVFLESNLGTEMTDQTVLDTNGSEGEETAARAKRQHVEINSVPDPIIKIQRPDEILKVMEHSKSSDFEGSEMDWDASIQQLGSPTPESISGPVAGPREEDPSAHTSKSHGQVVLNQQTCPLPLESEGLESPCLRGVGEADEVEEPHQGTVVTSKNSEAIQLVSQPQSCLGGEAVEAAVWHPDVTMQDQASQSVDQTSMEKVLINHESDTIAPKESNSTTNTLSIAVQGDEGSVPHSNGPALDIADKPRREKLQTSKSTSKPLFAPGFLNKPRPTAGSKGKLRSDASSNGAAVDRGQLQKVERQTCETVAANEQACSSIGECDAIDMEIVPEVDQVRPSDGISPAAANDDTPLAPNGEVSSCGNCMDCEVCNSAHLDSQIENGHEEVSGTAPDTSDENHSKNGSIIDRASASSKATKRNASVNSNGPSPNSPRVNIDEEPSVEPVSEAGAVSGRPANGKQKQGRNETCNCGSQRKWKKCCGKMGVIKPELGRRRLVV